MRGSSTDPSWLRLRGVGFGAVARAALLIAVAGLSACAPKYRVPVIVEPLAGVADGDASGEGQGSSAGPALTYAPQPAGPPGPASALAGEGFEPMGEARGVKVYRRKVPSGIEIAADGTLAGSPDRVLRVLNDYPGHLRWQERVAEQRILGRGDGFLDVYERLALPVIADRDYTLHVTWGSEGDLRWLRFTSVLAGGPPPGDGAVRAAAYTGSWRLEPIDGGKRTHAVYRFLFDIAGSFPAWLASGRTMDEVPELFTLIDGELPRYP